MARSGAIAVAALLLLAGCYGVVVLLDDAPAGDPTPAVPSDTGGEPTPGPTGDDRSTDRRPETRAEPEPTYLAPGLTTEGVLNVSLLLEHHYAALERGSGNGTYVAIARNTRTVLDVPPEEVFTSRERYTVQHPDRWHFSGTGTDHRTNETAVHEEWADESDWLYRGDRPDRPVEYDARDRSGAPGHPESLDLNLRHALQSVDARRSVDVTVEEQARNGTTVYVVTDTARNGPAVATSTVYVREDGFVTHYTQESVQNPSGDDTSRTERHLAFGIRPNGTLQPPNWTEDARRAASDDETDVE